MGTFKDLIRELVLESISVGNPSSWADGTVVTDDGRTVARPGMTLRDLLATGLDCKYSALPEGATILHVRVGPFVVDGNECIAVAGFRNECLLTFSLDLTEQAKDRRWGRQEPGGQVDRLERAAFYDNWVETKVGRRRRHWPGCKPPGRRFDMPWGDISTGADFRGHGFLDYGWWIVFGYVPQEARRRW